jgi:hypothetical protein
VSVVCRLVEMAEPWTSPFCVLETCQGIREPFAMAADLYNSRSKLVRIFSRHAEKPTDKSKSTQYPS